ncbi:hypothetical protein [Streptomyces sp. NPDC008121]|uniref:hypothetical protein n=1 Tax=Streptomyces sp. NPDC008121 TaxID=3364809 RepID=UPI0036E3D16E
MPDPHDPLRRLFQQAASSGQARADAPPFARIAERGRQARRRHVAGLTAAVCLALGGGVAAAVLVSGGPSPQPPATSPSPPLPAPTSRLSPSATTAPSNTTPPSSTPTSLGTDGPFGTVTEPPRGGATSTQP